MNSPTESPLKIVIMVHRFHPDVGGVEMTAQVLARGFAERHKDSVTVVTHTLDDSDDHMFPFRVVREPTRRQLRRVVKEADVVLHNNPCMQFAWANWVTKTPLVIAIRQFVTLPGQAMSAKERVKYHVKYAAIEGADELVANSDAMAAHLRNITTTIPNSYRDGIFHVTKPAQRPRQHLGFVGRMTPDKGASLLLEAVEILTRRGFDPQVTFMGDGPERTEMQERVRQGGLDGQVRFLGTVNGEQAAKVLNTCAIAVVPSRVPESFGTVALEEAACGCVVVGAGHGGLIQAIGPCGPLFEPGSAEDLANVLERLFTDDGYFSQFTQALPGHVEKHREHVMVDAYRDVLRRVVAGEGRNPDAHSWRGRLRRAVRPGPPGGI